jgi:hypothetical protein
MWDVKLNQEAYNKKCQKKSAKKKCRPTDIKRAKARLEKAEKNAIQSDR